MPELSLAAARHVDDACVRFETVLQAGTPATIEEYLGDSAEPLRSALLRELVRLEIDYRTRRGERPTVEEYRIRFPAHVDAIASWFPSEPTIGCSSPVAAPTSWPILPGYEIVAELGRGGMGVVYQARHVKFQRAVAIKMILAGEHAGAEQAARFLAEARAVARLQNPNIVQIHEIGEHNGLPYFSLEYVDGGNLATRLKGTPPSDMEAARLVELLARTVHYAHGRNIVHRDLKPANILLTLDGVPKIADFGLAKVLNEDSGATRTGVISGTPSYMAPEQASGKAKDIGPAVDIYALGAVLYELLTGRPPFRGETMLETLRLVEEQAPQPPHVFNPRVDPTLEAVCLKCLQKNPADRYPTAEKLANDLAAFQCGELVITQSGAASRLFGAVLRETRYTEVMRLWSGIWMGLAVMYLLICIAKSLLLWTEHASHGSFLVIWLAMLSTTVGLVWFCRLRSSPSLIQVERQMLQTWSFFWIGFFATAWLYYRVGAPVEGLVPILILQLGVVTACMAALLGGSFYVMAAACLVTAALEAYSPEVGALISGIGCSPALFWVGWKHSRRIP